MNPQPFDPSAGPNPEPQTPPCLAQPRPALPRPALRAASRGLASLLLLSGLGALPAWGQDERLAQQALQCSVLLQSLAQFEPLASTERWQAVAQHLRQVHGQVSGNVQGQDALWAQAQTQLQAAQRRQDPALLEEAVVCAAWAEAFAAQGAQWQYVPVFPKVILPTQRSRLSALVQRWLGRSE